SVLAEAVLVLAEAVPVLADLLPFLGMRSRSWKRAPVLGEVVPVLETRSRSWKRAPVSEEALPVLGDAQPFLYTQRRSLGRRSRPRGGGAVSWGGAPVSRSDGAVLPCALPFLRRYVASWNERALLFRARHPSRARTGSSRRTPSSTTRRCTRRWDRTWARPPDTSRRTPRSSRGSAGSLECTRSRTRPTAGRSGCSRTSAPAKCSPGTRTGC